MRRPTLFALSTLLLLSAEAATAQAPSPCLSSNGQVCSAHGTCVTNPAGQYCACFVGYEGFQCQRTAAPSTSCTAGAMNGVPCSGHGTCQETSSPSCVCAADFIGPQCQFLAHQAYACIAPSGQICNEHGTCMSTSAGEYCACFLNYTGAQCQTPVKGISRVPTLSVTRVLTETTSDNVGGCLGSNGAACSGNGNCVNGECDCSNGYYGQYCQYYASACVNTTNGMVCSGNGRCSVSSSGAATCTCFPGYAGSMCETPVTNMPVPVPVPTTTSNCTADANGAVCSGAGICLNGTCGCAEGYFGQYCQYRATPIPAPSCSNASPEGVVCSGHGQCISFAGVMQCQCTVGWVGAHCEAPFPTNTPATTTVLPQQAVGSAAEDTTASLPKTIGIAAIVAAVVALLVLGVGVALLRKRRGASAQPTREEGKNTVAFIAADDSVVCEMTPAECAHIGVPMLV